MNTYALFLSCLGAFIIIFNKFFGIACYSMDVEYHKTGHGLRYYRVGWIICGALMLLTGVVGLIAGDPD